MYIIEHDPYYLNLARASWKGRDWTARAALFKKARSDFEHMFIENERVQGSLNLHFLFVMDPTAKELTKKQQQSIRAMTFSSLIQTAELIVEEILFASHFCVKKIEAQKKYDKKPRIEIWYEYNGK
jgi:hypothetical protein